MEPCIDKDVVPLLSRPFVPATLLGVLILPACGRPQEAPAKPRAAAMAVRVVTVAQEDVVYAVRAVGSLQADEIVKVTAEVEGAVRDVSFNEGDHVTADTVLVRVDPERYRLEAAQAQAAYQKAEAARAQAEAELTRREALARESLISAEELYRAKQQLRRLLEP